ncbi:Uma2 family endonuclease [Streptomyces smyrnaeus]|uniref:Uma2 family endonuclease n=1 Tax=Streptomyces smyrnaeus TaxID=1387713 RepID=UPI0033BE8551
MTIAPERMDARMTDSHAINAFEELDVPEGFKAELLWGEIVMMAGPDLVHNRIVQAVADQIPRKRWDRLQTQDVALLAQTSEPQPDLVVLPRDAGPASGRLMPPEEITLLLEVVSKTSKHRDYVTKRTLYAAGGVPGYLIIDPFTGECVLLTEPAGKGEEADYRVERRARFGESLPLDLLGVKLATEEFQTLPVKQSEKPEQ